MIVGSLFSGAGLLDCGLQQAGVEHAWFVERDEFRRGLLAKRWPGVPIHDDVRTVGSHNLAGVDGIVGGFPCRGVSTAGKRTGLAHPETALWAEFFRIVRELRPCYVGIENVANLLAIHDGAVWGTVLGDLASVGYDVAWDCVPASAVGAPHGRDRVFAVARHADHIRRRADGAALRQGRPEAEWSDSGAAAHAAQAAVDAPADASHIGSERGRPARAGRLGSADGGQAPADADASGRRAGAERAAPRAGGNRRQDGPATDGNAEAPADAERDVAELRRGAGDVGEAARGGGRAAREQWDGRSVADRAEDAPDASRLREGGPGEAARPDGQRARQSVDVEWGEYEPAIRRWEAIHGTAPEPLVRGMDDGDAKLRRVRARVDRSRLSALGDGVHVHVGRLLGEALMALYREETAEREAA